MIRRASHLAVGCRVTSNHSSCRRSWPSTRNANNRSKIRVGTTIRSMAAIAGAWFRKNVFQPCDCDPPRTMYLDYRRLGGLKAKHQQLAVDPRCSPLWFSGLMRRMRSRNSRSIFGRPTRFRDFQRQSADRGWGGKTRKGSE